MITSAMLKKDESLNQKVLSIAKELEIEKLLDKFPYECSGGECQRIAIARALINDPEIIFCDEPTGNLDSKNSKKIIEILSQLNKKGVTILLVTHDPHIASYCQKVMYLEDGYIKTTLEKRNQTKEEFYHDINEITSRDSILQKIKNNTDEEIIENNHIEVEEVTVEEKKPEKLIRQRIYMSFKGNQLSKDIRERYTICNIDEDQLVYFNKYNEEIKIDTHRIKEINLDIKLPEVYTFSMFSSPICYINMDICVEEDVYQFEVRNKDDLIDIIHYFMNLNIVINDPKDIINVYKQYPKDYERQKYYFRTYIMKKKRG